MSRRIVANTISSTAALVAGMATFYASTRLVGWPDTSIESAQQVCAGMTLAIIVFFLAWGHFQQLPSEKTPAPVQRPRQP